jgi:hypothetical protein
MKSSTRVISQKKNIYMKFPIQANVSVVIEILFSFEKEKKL